MLKTLGNIISAIICVSACVFMVLTLFVCIFTPHKTKYGTFTDPYKYWTDDAYVCANFECKNIEKLNDVELKR